MAQLFANNAVTTLAAQLAAGSYRAHLVTFDPVNTNGVRWPEFKLKVK